MTNTNGYTITRTIVPIDGPVEAAPFIENLATSADVGNELGYLEYVLRYSGATTAVSSHQVVAVWHDRTVVYAAVEAPVAFVTCGHEDDYDADCETCRADFRIAYECEHADDEAVRALIGPKLSRR